MNCFRTKICDTFN